MGVRSDSISGYNHFRGKLYKNKHNVQSVCTERSVNLGCTEKSVHPGCT